MSVDGLALRKRMGRHEWAPPRPYGLDGWSMVAANGAGSIIVSCAPFGGAEWVHASIAWPARLPTYDELATLRSAVWGPHGWAYQVFAPPDHHVNLHEHALHLFGRLDGARVLPDFTCGSGSI